MFSVIIPLYNKELSITATIQSVLAQTFTDFEIVVVNDGSTDGSLRAVEAIKDTRIRIIDKVNGGVSSARNRGIVEATREWIAFLDGDDLWRADHLSTLASLIQSYPEDRVFSSSYMRSNQKYPDRIDNSVNVINDYFKEAIKQHFFWTSVACINKEVFHKTGNFEETLSRGEDLELWTRIGREYRFIKSNLVTAIYRIDAENRSNQSFNLDKTRVFNYNFKYSRSNSEYLYYKHQIVSTLITLLMKRNFKNFFKLKKKHSGHISYLDILKRVRRR